MKWSSHNILSRISDSENYIIVNLLWGEADLITPSDASAIMENREPTDPLFIQKHYWVDETEENNRYRTKYLEFIDAREKEEIQLFFVPWYSCNFACSYCFQDQYAPAAPDLSINALDAFFDYINKSFSDRRKYITLFGGEPLMSGAVKMEYIKLFIEKAAKAELSVAIVTNGYNLAQYGDILSRGIIREIQITLDGTEEFHNNRRPLKGGGETFNSIVNGIDLSLANGYNVNLRVVVDKKNIDNLVDLANFAVDKGWTTNPLFKTQIGRNYELHHCQSSPSDLFDRAALYEKLYKLASANPEILSFHKPAFSVIKILSENGRLPDPLFDACPGTKSEWAFDSAGRIFACTATVGKTEEQLGSFYPSVSLNNSHVSEWESRDIYSIPECSKCESALACGGGCASIAKNKTGRLNSPDCRPIKELVGMGTALYFREEIKSV